MSATPQDTLKIVSNHCQNIRKPSRFYAESRSEDARAATRYIILIRRPLRPRRGRTNIFLCLEPREGLAAPSHIMDGIELGCARPGRD